MQVHFLASSDSDSLSFKELFSVFAYKIFTGEKRLDCEHSATCILSLTFLYMSNHYRSNINAQKLTKPFSIGTHPDLLISFI